MESAVSINPKLQSNFQAKINQYEEEQKMEFLSTMEELAIERTAKETSIQNIIDLLQKRFNSVPET
ncbi:hypothetical protein AFK68_11770, partial [Hydrocoleum sp. CS-953]|uniref:hypothetical protein n=1 Tax=Hydrocoleum sp. CS-953 TaxID=1671698 RepID=UPI000BD6871F